MSVAVCEMCESILGGGFATRHEADACPIRRGSYCGLCASYGHSPSECPDIMVAPYRAPMFLEQLIPAHLLETHGITSQTLLPAAAEGLKAAAAPGVKAEYYMEVSETDEALRAVLTSFNVKPMICQEKGKREKTELTENKKRLQKVADRLGRKLIFVPVVEKAGEAVAKKNKTAAPNKNEEKNTPSA